MMVVKAMMMCHRVRVCMLSTECLLLRSIPRTPDFLLTCICFSSPGVYEGKPCPLMPSVLLQPSLPGIGRSGWIVKVIKKFKSSHFRRVVAAAIRDDSFVLMTYVSA